MSGLSFMSLIFLEGLFSAVLLSYLAQAVSLKTVQDGCDLEK